MSREHVLARIRASLEPGRRGDRARRDAAEQRIANAIAHPVPACAQQSAAALRDRFEAELARQGANVVVVAAASEIPSAVASYLAGLSLARRLRIGRDAMLAGLPWGAPPQLTVDQGAADASDAVALSRALAGVAETGTLVLASGPDNPTTLAFLPETHIVVVDGRDVVGPLEDAFGRVRSHYGAGNMPRSLNLVSGPSRTGDIGGRIVLGAHGPRRLAVIIVGHRPPDKDGAGLG